VSSDQTIKIWDIASGILQQTLKGHSDWINSIAFSHDSTLLASASDDRTVKIWDTASGMLQQTLTVNSYVLTLLFDITNSILFTNIGHFKIAKTRISPLPISSQAVGSKSDCEGLGISGPWVRWNNKNLLWLPPDFRAATSNISLSGSKLGIGCSSGKVFLIGISIDILRRYFA
jgi:WD40 repeat protein